MTRSGTSSCGPGLPFFQAQVVPNGSGNKGVWIDHRADPFGLRGLEGAAVGPQKSRQQMRKCALAASVWPQHQNFFPVSIRQRQAGENPFFRIPKADIADHEWAPRGRRSCRPAAFQKLHHSFQGAPHFCQLGNFAEYAAKRPHRHPEGAHERHIAAERHSPAHDFVSGDDHGGYFRQRSEDSPKGLVNEARPETLVKSCDVTVETSPGSLRDLSMQPKRIHCLIRLEGLPQHTPKNGFVLGFLHGCFPYRFPNRSDSR